jgi:hypothetical protein
VQGPWSCTFFSSAALSFFPSCIHWLVLTVLQIARYCPEGRDPVVEEDNTWGEVQDDPWSGGGAFDAVDGN